MGHRFIVGLSLKGRAWVTLAQTEDGGGMPGLRGWEGPDPLVLELDRPEENMVIITGHGHAVGSYGL
jgi:hypothetical protein